MISTIGSFTNIRGGHVYPDLIRQSETEADPRSSCRTAVNDNRGIRGEGADAKYDPKWDWHAQNIKMAAGADREGLRRQLHLGHRHALQQAGRRDHARDAPLALARLRTPSGRSARPDQPHDARAWGFAPPAQPAVGPPPSPRDWSPAELKRLSYHSEATGAERDYYVYLPEGFAQKDRWPVLLTLSGNGERGDGKNDLDYVLANGPLFEAWSQRRRLPFVIIAPQLPMFHQGNEGFITSRTRDKIRVPTSGRSVPTGPTTPARTRWTASLAIPTCPSVSTARRKAGA